MSPTQHRVTTDDGVALRVEARAHAERPAACVVIQAALGTPQKRYAPLAAYLAERGFAAVTYDYRDMGGNRRGPARASSARVSDWGRRDQTAVLAWARARYPESRLVVLGHSMGGQILGFTPRTADLDGVVLVSAQSTYYRHWEGADRWKMLALWGVALPGLNRAFGYMPGSAFGGEDLPPGCTPEGTRWALRSSFIGDEHGVAENLSQLCCPVLAYSFTDDRFHAPRSAVEAFLAQLRGADVQHRHVSPTDFGLERIGHFGFFSARSRPLWDDLCAHLAGSDGAPSPGSEARRPAAVATPSIKARRGQTALMKRSIHDLVAWSRQHSRMALRDVFADLVRFSREVDRKNPLTEDVQYGLYQDPKFGELPLVKPPPRAMVKALPLALRWKYSPTKVESGRYASVAEAHEDALRYFGSLPDPEHYEHREEHLGDAWLHHMVTSKFSLWLEPNAPGDGPASPRGKPEYKVDLEFMRELAAAPGYERHGGKVVLDEDGVRYITHHGRNYFPGDPDWELVKYKFRACSFAWVTLLHTVLHVREAAKLFTATHRFIPHTHPLHALLLPYLYGTHRNVARLQRTVTGAKGVTAAVAGFTSGPDAIDFVARRTGVRLCPEYEVQWTEHYRDVRALWDILHAHVSDYVRLYRLDASTDGQVERWLRYLGENAHPRLFTRALSPESDLGLVDVITYLMFSVSVLHFAMGHIMNGTTDPRYISASVFQSDSRDLWSIVSSRDECLIRLAVYATINRHTYRLTDDFSDLCTDNRGRAIVRSLANAMKARTALMEEENRGRTYPRMIVPSAIASSAAQ